MDSLTGKQKLFDPANHQPSPNNLLSLPPDMVTEIVARVAASSLFDLNRTKLCCKELKAVAEEKYVYQHACLNNIPNSWHIYKPDKKYDLFHNKCRLYKNTEALYRQGVIDYFGHNELQSAMCNLKEAADSGHMGASYAMAIIYLFASTADMKQKGVAADMKHKGLTMLFKMKTTSMKRKVKDCRASLCQIINQNIWRAHPNKKQQKSCKSKHKTRSNWDNGYDSDCEACAYDEEIISICNAFRADRSV